MKCALCPKEIKPTSNRQMYCEECRKSVTKAKMREYHKRTYVRKGYNQRGAANNNWKGGIGMYREYKKDTCEKCPETANLLVHHRDGNRYNNDPSNLETLCKRCHQVEHECHKNLPDRKTLSSLKKKQAKTAKRDSLGKFIK